MPSECETVLQEILKSFVRELVNKYQWMEEERGHGLKDVWKLKKTEM